MPKKIPERRRVVRQQDVQKVSRATRDLVTHYERYKNASPELQSKLAEHPMYQDLAKIARAAAESGIIDG